VRHNLPRREDLTWLAKGGGMFVAGSHPPARKFNAGQKLLYWLVVLGGFSLSLSGIALMWPFEFSLFGPTFKVLNVVGFNLPTALTPMQEVQFSQLWHGLVSLFLIALVIAHIYIGTIGMEGAYDAMGNGMVDENWAREHHSLWVAEMKKLPAGGDE
jgi:formate dehydrogenase subunit gamma